MGLEIILKEIKENSEKEIENINNESENDSKKIIDSAKEKISNINKEENEALLLKLIKKYESTGSKIYSNSKSENIIKKLSKLKYSGNINCIGGFIIENENGSIKQEYTYDLILKNIYEKSIKHISEILHG